VDEFVSELPQGWHTPLGEAGQRLSSGQAQRLALARAFLRDAPLLLLDEPTAHLDPEQDDLLGAVIERLRGGRTVLLIAHRLGSVTGADRVAVLDQGRVLEQGQPGELRLTGGAYARLLAAAEGRA
jgi:ATP-binding cassette subfamily C protein CydD